MDTLVEDKVVNVSLVYNPFDITNLEQHELAYQDGKKLADYIEGLPEGANWKIGLNGMPIEPEKYATTEVLADDTIVVMCIPYGGGGDKSILRMLAQLAVAVAAAAVAYFVGGLLGAVLAAAIMVVGSFLVNLALPMTPLKDKSKSDGNSYGYDGAKNTSKEGTPLPVIYGQFQVAGNYIDLYTENIGDDQYMHGRVVLSDGEIAGVVGNPEINEQDINNFKNVQWGYTAGTPTETVNTNFVGSKQQFFQDVKLTTTYSQYDTTGNVDGFELDFMFPQGLANINKKDGTKSNISVTVEIQYAPYGTTNWTNPGTNPGPGGHVPFNPGSGSPGGSTGHVVSVRGTGGSGVNGVASYNLQYRTVGSTPWTTYQSFTDQADSFNTAQTWSTGTNKYNSYNNALYDVGTASYAPAYTTKNINVNLPAGAYQFQVTGNGTIANSVALPATTAPGSGGASASTTVTYTDNRTKTLRKTYKSPTLPRGRYSIRYRRTVAEDLSHTDWITECHCSGVTEVQNSNVAMRNVATGWYVVKMTDQLASIPNFTWKVQGVKVDIYDNNGAVTSNSWSANPADIVLDMLISDKRGPLRNKIQIDFPAFVKWRTYCANNGFLFNGVFDTTTTLWDALMDVFKVGRAYPVRTGSKLSVAVDMPANPVQLFGPGNIIKDTFQISYLGMQDRANEFEVSYYDASDRNKKKTIRIADPQAAQAGQIPKTVAYELFGIDNFTQAQKEVWYQLYNNRLSRRVIQFDAPIEAIGLTLGDVALIQHDMMNWGSSGRLGSGSTTTSIVLDKPVTIAAGKTYSLLVNHDKISKATCNIALASGTTYNLTGLSTTAPTTDTLKRLQTNTNAEAEILDFSYTGGTNATVTLSTTVTGTTATLWDVDVGEERTVGGTNLVTNGDFSGGSTGWTTYAGVTISGGKANATTATQLLTQTGIFTVGQNYTVTFDYTMTAGSKLRITNATVNNTGIVYTSGVLGASGTITATFTATGTPLTIEADTANFSGTIDNVVVTGPAVTPGTYTTLPVTSAFSAAPNQYAMWMFGEQTTVKKPYRLRSIAGTDLEKRTLVFGEYNSYIYSAPETTVPAPGVAPSSFPNHINNLAFAIDPLRTGTTVQGTLSWAADNVLNYAGVDIYQSINGADFAFLTSVQAASSFMLQVQEGSTVAFKVVAYNSYGVRAAINTAPSVSRTVNTAAGSLVEPTGLTWTLTKVNFLADGFLSWTAASDSLGNVSPVSRVQVKYAGSTNWLDKGLTNQTTFQLTNVPQGTHQFQVRAENSTGQCSDWVVQSFTVGVPTLVTPTIAVDGSAVDHVINADGSADISFQWAWSGNEIDIDGWEVIAHNATVNTAYTLGTSPITETINVLSPSKRAVILYGVPANKWYTFYVRPFKTVHNTYNANGKIYGTAVKPSLAAENPYQPSANVAFTGSIVGTINVTDINQWGSISSRPTNLSSLTGSEDLRNDWLDLAQDTGGPGGRVRTRIRSNAVGVGTYLTHDDALQNSQIGGWTALGDHNRVRFSRFEGGTNGWIVADCVGVTPSFGALGPYNGLKYVQIGAFNFTANGQQAGIGTDSGNSGYNIPVVVGERLFVSAGISYANAPASTTMKFDIGWLDSTGVETGTRTTIFSGTGTGDPFNTRRGGFCTVPANATHAFLRVYLFNNTGGASTGTYLQVTQPMVCSAGANQTAWPSFIPGPSNEFGATLGARSGPGGNLAGDVDGNGRPNIDLIGTGHQNRQNLFNTPSNLCFNGNFRLLDSGNNVIGWSGSGFSTQPNLGENRYVYVSAGTGTYTFFSDPIQVFNANYYLQVEMYAGGITSGQMYADVQWYDSGGTLINDGGGVVAVNGTGWTKYVSGPQSYTGAATARVRLVVDGPATISAGNVVAWRKVMFSCGNVSGGETPFNDHYTNSHTVLTRQGTGVTIGDQRNLPPIAAANLRYKFTGSVGYDAPVAGSPATSTARVGAGSLILGSTSISYSAMTAAISGTGGTTTDIYLYVNSNGYVAGGHTLLWTTTGNSIYQNDQNVYIGTITVTWPTSGTGTGGTGGGGGGGTCVWEDAYVHTERGWIPAKEVIAGDKLRVLTDDREGLTWETVEDNTEGEEQCYVVKGEHSGFEVTISESTPITLKDGTLIKPHQIDGHLLPFEEDGKFWWEPCHVTKDIVRKVRHIYCNMKTYSAGNVAGKGILTHNPKP